MHLEPSAGLIATSFRSLPPFELVRARSIEEAVEALATAAGRADVLAGGTDLPARFNEGLFPNRLVDISRIGALRGIRREGDDLVIGALTTHEEGSRDPLLDRLLPGFARAWARIANVRVRKSATIGGNLMARRTRYEAAILLDALDARLVYRTAQGSREAPIASIWTENAEGLLVAIRLPLRSGLAFDYDRSMRPIFTQAIAAGPDGQVRIAAATEYSAPRVTLIDAQAVETYAPGPFGDPVAGDAWLAHVSRVILRRQIQRIKGA